MDKESIVIASVCFVSFMVMFLMLAVIFKEDIQNKLAERAKKKKRKHLKVIK